MLQVDKWEGIGRLNYGRLKLEKLIIIRAEALKLVQ